MPKMTIELQEKIENNVKSLLHSSRDCLRNRGINTSKTTFDCNDGYYGEAFGIMRCLSIMGYGYFGADNVPDKGNNPRINLKWWFTTLRENVLEEENFGGSNKCDHCVDKWGKDGAGRTRGQRCV